MLVRLTDARGNRGSGQVSLVAVDKAMLAVRPHPVAHLSPEMRPSMRGGSYAMTDTYRQLAAPSSILASLVTRRWEEDLLPKEQAVLGAAAREETREGQASGGRGGGGGQGISSGGGQVWRWGGGVCRHAGACAPQGDVA